MDHLEILEKKSPKVLQNRRAIEQHTQNFIRNGVNTREVITIPVVFHIVHNGTTENISDAQIQTQLDVLNADFRRLNSDADNTWAQAVDSEIEFCLASVDPSGNSTTGITRTSTSVSSFTYSSDNVKFNATGGHDAWPAANYMNFWVCDLEGGLLGYAQFPGGPANTDGVVCDYAYVGTIGTATSPFDLGRTATHEVGHYLNLYHIWGDGGCGVDDEVADTPQSDASNGGCATGHVSCGTVDMVQNYMDYSNDACMNLFTVGQKARMTSIFSTGGSRASLLSSPACGSGGGGPTCNDGIQNGNETGVDCGGPDCPDCPTCSDGVMNGSETGVDCGGPDCDACSGGGGCTDITVKITLDRYGSETTWTLKDASGSTIASGGPYSNNTNGTVITSTSCLAEGCYDFTINDAYGDGICCSYGSGSYELTNPSGTVLASGGNFGSTEIKNFCIGGGSTPTCNDGVMNGDETGVDCGGSDCPACPTCNDGVQNGDETGVDCGGSDCPACPTCNDGVQNGDETGVDCGGSDCPACTDCNDGIQNGDETGVDCGGSDCPACTDCNDGIQNGNETGVDCGGSDCPACPTCNDGVMNGNETGVDCGGPDCDACSGGGDCTDITIKITLDRYGVETTWTLKNASGTTIASGGPYTNNNNGQVITSTSCLEEGCYDFTINDAYGDGICCAYGNGAYELTNPSGTVLASGGSFASSETKNFCVGGGLTPTCNDGVMNGNETGVDCGGPDCDACSGGGGDCSSPTTIDSEDFEADLGIWIDGGSDCTRSFSASFANSGSFSLRLRDNTFSSVATTNALDLSSYNQLTVSFSYMTRSMDNANEDFWLQISTDGGASFQTVEEWNQGDEFVNNQRYNETVVINSSFTANTLIRFRCDASSNNDYVYLDDISISACSNGAREIVLENNIATIQEEKGFVSNLNLFPNPTSGLLNVSFEVQKARKVEMLVTDFTGRQIQVQQLGTIEGQQNLQIDALQMTAGFYFVHFISEGKRITKKFVVAK